MSLDKVSTRLLLTFFVGLAFSIAALLGLAKFQEAEWFQPQNQLSSLESSLWYSHSTNTIHGTSNETISSIIASIKKIVDAVSSLSPVSLSSLDSNSTSGFGVDKWAGYTRAHFHGLMIFSVGAPVGLSLLLAGFQNWVRLASSKRSYLSLLAASLSVAGVLGVIVGYSYYWSSQVLVCGIVACINTDNHTWKPVDTGYGDGAVGWRTQTGLMTMFGAGGLLIAVLANLVTNWIIVSSAKEQEQYFQEIESPTINTSLLTNGSLKQQQKFVQSGSNFGSNLGVNSSMTNIDSKPDFVPSNATKEGVRFVTLSKPVQSTVIYDVMVLLSCLIVFAAFFFTTTYIPNAFSGWTPSNIAETVMKKVSHVAEECGVGVFHCPEYAWAFFKSQMFALTNHWNIVLFPGNVMFYLYIAIVPTYAFISKYSNTMRRFGARKVSIKYRTLSYFIVAPFKYCFSKNGNTEDKDTHPSLRLRQVFFSVNEILWILFTTVITYTFFHYWFFDHNFHNNWPKHDTILSEKICRAMGQMGVLFFAFLMFPAARNSPMYSILGLSWEGAMKYHRWLGSGFLFFGAAHGGAAYWWYADRGTFPSDLVDIPMRLPPAVNNFTVPHAHWVLWICIIALGITSSFESIRRRKFEFFLICHHISFLTMIPCLIWHAAASWEFMLPGCVLWVLDRSMRFYRSSRCVDIPTVAELKNSKYTPVTSWGLPSTVVTGVPGASVANYNTNGEIIEIVVKAPGMNIQAGHYVFINVAEVSLFEWHPITVSSPCRIDNEYITLHIKTMGEGTWTQSLAKLIKENAEKNILPQQGITVSLDGPHGHPIDFRKYDTIYLVSAGIGMTPCKSIFESLLAATEDDVQKLTKESSLSNISKYLEDVSDKHVKFICVGRDKSFFHLMKDS